MANFLLDDSRFPGDDTIRGYSGPLKAFLMNLQLILRVVIATKDAFPKCTDFERTIAAIFETKAQDAIEHGCE